MLNYGASFYVTMFEDRRTEGYESYLIWGQYAQVRSLEKNCQSVTLKKSKSVAFLRSC